LSNLSNPRYLNLPFPKQREVLETAWGLVGEERATGKVLEEDGVRAGYDVGFKGLFSVFGSIFGLKKP